MGMGSCTSVRDYECELSLTGEPEGAPDDSPVNRGRGALCSPDVENYRLRSYVDRRSMGPTWGPRTLPRAYRCWTGSLERRVE